jgi:outer membrane receptor for ferrienterochelin and colicins
MGLPGPLRWVATVGWVALCLASGARPAVATTEDVLTAKGPQDTRERSLLDLSLEELLDLEVQVASAEPQTTREAPAVVTVVTRQEIEQSGARDLIDVLRRVSGFDFGVDVWGVVGIGFRGHWGHEGKVMLAVDGMIMNELMYGNLAFGSHFPIAQIERIEIVRGPGSVIHGNSAELAVINIITKIGSEQSGLRAGTTAGQFEGGYARLNLDASYGRASGAGADGAANSYFGISASGSTAQRSTQTYTDIYGASYAMNGNQELKDQQFEMQYRRGGLRAQFLYDAYRTNARDADVAIVPAPLDEDFFSYLGGLSYAFTPRPGLKITPEFKVTVEQPWRNNDDPNSEIVFYEATAQRYSGTVKANWDPTASLNLLLGGQYDWEGADYGDRAGYFFPNGKTSIDYNRRALFAEAYLKLADVNFTGGLRWDDHCEYPAAFAPRLSVTRMFNGTHFKYIYNRSYKAPSIEQISSGVNVRTEEADVYEIEIGREFRPTLYGGINLFDIQLSHPLIYVSQDGTIRNFEDIDTRGAEVEGRLHGRWGDVTARYSFYTAADGLPENYAVPGVERVVLGFPAHKVVLLATLRASSALTVSSSMIFTSAKYAYTHVDETSGEPRVSRLGPEAPVDVYARYAGLFTKRLSAGLGVSDLFGANHVFVQPYNGLHAPLPGAGRELVLRIEYEF